MTATPKGAGRTAGSRPAASLLVHVQPRARHTEIVGWHGDAIKIRVAAPPVDRAANDELLRFLARRLGVPAAQVRLTAGSTSRRKRFEIVGLDNAMVLDRLDIR